MTVFFCKIKAMFQKFRQGTTASCFHDQFLIPILRFCTILRVVETQVVKEEKHSLHPGLFPGFRLNVGYRASKRLTLTALNNHQRTLQIASFLPGKRSPGMMSPVWSVQRGIGVQTTGADRSWRLRGNHPVIGPMWLRRWLLTAPATHFGD